MYVRLPTNLILSLTPPCIRSQPQTPTHLEDITEIIRKDTEKERSKFETPASAGTVPRNQVGQKVGRKSRCC